MFKRALSAPAMVFDGPFGLLQFCNDAQPDKDSLSLCKVNDRFISVCEVCQEHYQGECSEHCPIRPYADTATSGGSMKAMSSLPEGMEVRESGIKGAGLGVFATEVFLSGATFGPYDGDKVRADVPKGGLDTSYMWEVSDFSDIILLRILSVLRYGGGIMFLPLYSPHPRMQVATCHRQVASKVVSFSVHSSSYPSTSYEN